MTERGTLLAIDHVQLAMPAGGEDRARAFYHGLLGIPEVPKPPELAKRGGCWFEAVGLRIHLGVDPVFRAAHKAHPAFIVDGLVVLVARLRAQGCVVTADTAIAGIERVFVDDPFGNRIELIEASVS